MPGKMTVADIVITGVYGLLITAIACIAGFYIRQLKATYRETEIKHGEQADAKFHQYFAVRF